MGKKKIERDNLYEATENLVEKVFLGVDSRHPFWHSFAFSYRLSNTGHNGDPLCRMWHDTCLYGFVQTGHSCGILLSSAILAGSNSTVFYFCPKRAAG